jgi:2-keto-4-pentenoate hydratase/2-oxohepta-3-ene-1,7-dioic acid hydratase in catechol pathway
MKIICVGRNYAEHATELGNERPTEPVIFLKPDTALLRPNLPFYHPGFSQEIHYECELVVRICKEGKHISPLFASKYYEQIGLGIDFTARDLQNTLKAKGLPWELAKAFDNSAVCSPFLAKDKFPNLKNVHFQLYQNEKVVQTGNTQEMLFAIDEIIVFVSQYFTLKIGDLIYTGTPKGVGKIAIGDMLEGFLEGNKMFSVEIK